MISVSSCVRVEGGLLLGGVQATVGICGGRFSWRDVLMRGDAKQTTGDCLGLMVLSSMNLAVS